MSRSTARRRTIVVGGLALLVLGGGAALALEWPSGGSPSSSWSASPSSTPSGTSTSARPVGAAPVPSVAATTAPAAGTRSTSAPSATRTTGAAGPASSGPAAATPTVHSVVVNPTYSGWDANAKEIVAGGYVGNLVESGGTCTLTLTRAGVVVRSTSAPATPDATTTDCGELRAGGAKLVSGSWDAVLTYASARSTGTSAVFPVVIP